MPRTSVEVILKKCFFCMRSLRNFMAVCRNSQQVLIPGRRSYETELGAASMVFIVFFSQTVYAL